MMSSKKDGKLTSHYRTAKPTSTPSSKTRQGKRRREEEETPDPEVLARSHGGGAVSRIDLGEDEQKLRKFDLQTKFGPCAGVSRLERWERAQKFGLEPPPEVRDIILSLGGAGSEADRCLWHERI